MVCVLYLYGTNPYPLQCRGAPILAKNESYTRAKPSHYKPVKCEQIMENNIGTDLGVVKLLKTRVRWPNNEKLQRNIMCTDLIFFHPVGRSDYGRKIIIINNMYNIIQFIVVDDLFVQIVHENLANKLVINFEDKARMHITMVHVLYGTNPCSLT